MNGMLLDAAAAAGEKEARVDSERAKAPRRNSLKNNPEIIGAKGIQAIKPSTPDKPGERQNLWIVQGRTNPIAAPLSGMIGAGNDDPLYSFIRSISSLSLVFVISFVLSFTS